MKYTDEQRIEKICSTTQKLLAYLRDESITAEQVLSEEFDFFLVHRRPPFGSMLRKSGNSIQDCKADRKNYPSTYKGSEKGILTTCIYRKIELCPMQFL